MNFNSLLSVFSSNDSNEDKKKKNNKIIIRNDIYKESIDEYINNEIKEPDLSLSSSSSDSTVTLNQNSKVDLKYVNINKINYRSNFQINTFHFTLTTVSNKQEQEQSYKPQEFHKILVNNSKLQHEILNLKSENLSLKESFNKIYEDNQILYSKIKYEQERRFNEKQIISSQVQEINRLNLIINDINIKHQRQSYVYNNEDDQIRRNNPIFETQISNEIDERTNKNSNLNTFLSNIIQKDKKEDILLFNSLKESSIPFNSMYMNSINNNSNNKQNTIKHKDLSKEIDNNHNNTSCNIINISSKDSINQKNISSNKTNFSIMSIKGGGNNDITNSNSTMSKSINYNKLNMNSLNTLNDQNISNNNMTYREKVNNKPIIKNSNRNNTITVGSLYNKQHQQDKQAKEDNKIKTKNEIIQNKIDIRQGKINKNIINTIQKSIQIQNNKSNTGFTIKIPSSLRGNIK